MKNIEAAKVMRDPGVSWGESTVRRRSRQDQTVSPAPSTHFLRPTGHPSTNRIMGISCGEGNDASEPNSSSRMIVVVFAFRSVSHLTQHSQ